MPRLMQEHTNIKVVIIPAKPTTIPTKPREDFVALDIDEATGETTMGKGEICEGEERAII